MLEFAECDPTNKLVQFQELNQIFTSFSLCISFIAWALIAALDRFFSKSSWSIVVLFTLKSFLNIDRKYTFNPVDSLLIVDKTVEKLFLKFF